MTLDALELARRESAVSNEGGMIAYRIISSRRLPSATSLGGALKISSSETTRERSTLTLLLTAKDPYRVVSQCLIPSRELWANFVVRVHSRDSLEKRSEWTESGRGLLDIAKSLDLCIPVVSF